MPRPVAVTPIEPAMGKPPHPLQDFWKSFSQNKGAMVGLGVVAAFILVALFAPLISPMDPTQQFQGDYRLPPFWAEGGQMKYLLGTDDLGRDLLSRLIYGARISMGVGLLVATFALIVGTFFGIISGFIGGWVDAVIMRIVDIVMSLPSILLAIVVVTVLGPGLFNAVIAVSIVKVPSFIRLVRASYMVEKQKEYVTASKSFGASRLRLAVINIFPNTTAPLIIQTTLAFSDGILDIAALGFLGLGAQPPTPEWGTILVQAKSFFTTSPWFVTLPGLCILLAVLGFNLMGDGLRDALDPRMKK